MEPRIQSSFIPKNPTSFENKPKRRQSMGLFFVVSVILLVIAGLVWGGLFFYREYLVTELERKSQELENIRSAVAPALVQEIERLDTRITTAGELLDQHVAVSELFTLLSETTLQTVEFNTLNYQLLPDGTVAVSLIGVAHNFASLALQADTFEAESAFLNPIIANPNVDDEGGVVFNFSAKVSPEALLYSNAFVPPPAEMTSDDVGTTTEAATTTGTVEQ